jgi:hypothetical protein
MAVVVKFVLKDLNHTKLIEEAQALAFSSVFQKVDWYGFSRKSDRIMTPNTETVKVGEVNSVSDFAQPGELRIHTSRDLTLAEDAALVAVLTAHNSATVTAEQTRQDQDDADIVALITAAQQFSTFLANFDAASNVPQLKAALRPFCVNVGRAIRNIVRKQRSASV